MKNLKQKSNRGFSLVELMVVVAIMGTLASIAIPAFNSYRKSAKKSAYKADLTALHKGWQAFGVELDSFCERETQPATPSFSSVGMNSLTNSKLYGSTSTQARVAPSCSGGSAPTPASCVAPGETGTVCSGCTVTTEILTAGRAAIPAGNGPGKVNLVGFADAHSDCSSISATLDGIHVIRDAVGTTDTDCKLGVTTYKMGVFGHISGGNYIGFQIDNNGVVNERAEGASSTVGDTCS